MKASDQSIRSAKLLFVCMCVHLYFLLLRVGLHYNVFANFMRVTKVMTPNESGCFVFNIAALIIGKEWSEGNGEESEYPGTLCSAFIHLFE